MSPEVYLASESPRRAALLEQIGVGFRKVSVDVEEHREPGELPEEFVSRMALEKARAGWDAVQDRESLPVLGADTVVVVDDEVLGKPRDVTDALRHLGRLSGRAHLVLSAVSVVGASEAVRVSTSRVWFRPMSIEERTRYCATGEPLDKAGSYAVQGLAAAFIERLEGSYSGVMGLPLYETAALLSEAGIDVIRN